MKKSTLKAITGVSVLCVLVLALGAVSSWFTNWNTSTWFGRGGNNAIRSSTEDEPKACAYDDYGNDVVDGDILPEHMIFYRSSVDTTAASFVQTSATSERASITLQAIITPEDATVTNVEWTVSYVGDGTGNVAEYVTATPLENKLNATIECIQPFGAQIEIEVRVEDIFGDVRTAECLLDFLSVPNGIASYNLTKTANGMKAQYETVYNVGAPKFLYIYYTGTDMYHYSIGSFTFSWTIGTVHADVSTTPTKVYYYTPNTANISGSVDDPLGYLDRYWKMCGDKLDADNRYLNYVHFVFGENKYNFTLLFLTDHNKPVDSVSIDNPSHTFE